MEDKSDDIIALEALEKAEEAFNEHIESYSLDPSYFEFKKKCEILDVNFEAYKYVKSGDIEDKEDLE